MRALSEIDPTVANIRNDIFQALGGMAERQAPRLFPDLDDLRARSTCPLVPASVQFPGDLSVLLRFSQAAAATGRPAPWQLVLPIYPTSPVGEA